MQRADETDYDIYDANYTWQPKLMQVGGVNGLIPGGATKQDEQCSRTPLSSRKFTKVRLPAVSCKLVIHVLPL